MRPTNAHEAAADKLRRKNIDEMAGKIELVALHLRLDESCAVMEACRTIRCAARGYVKRMVRTTDGQDARHAGSPIGSPG